jgi:AraC-like DNA-binding protein
LERGEQARNVKPDVTGADIFAAMNSTRSAQVGAHSLERASFRLLVHDASILSIALDCGFDRHETFTVEIYHASAIRTRDRLPHTDICLPVRRRGVR